MGPDFGIGAMGSVAGGVQNGLSLAIQLKRAMLQNQMEQAQIQHFQTMAPLEEAEAGQRLQGEQDLNAPLSATPGLESSIEDQYGKGYENVPVRTAQAMGIRPMSKFMKLRLQRSMIQTTVNAYNAISTTMGRTMNAQTALQKFLLGEQGRLQRDFADGNVVDEDTYHTMDNFYTGALNNLGGGGFPALDNYISTMAPLTQELGAQFGLTGGSTSQRQSEPGSVPAGGSSMGGPPVAAPTGGGVTGRARLPSQRTGAAPAPTDGKPLDLGDVSKRNRKSLADHFGGP